MKLSVFGATGSIGENLFAVVDAHRELFEFDVLAGGANVDKMAELVARYRPAVVAMASEAAAAELSDRIGLPVSAGEAALIDLAARPVDLMISSITGIAGLRPTWSAVEAGNDVALANKESLVCAGALLIEEVARRGVKLWPVDSEHNAILQCLAGASMAEVDSVTLTASGGPFVGFTVEQLRSVTREQALAHPNWSMGAKISIDSSTLVNKGLELIEAGYLFDLPGSRIHAVVHRQSIIHSFVHYRDGSSLAQLSYPSMTVPISHVLSSAGDEPRLALPAKRLDATTMGSLDFAPVDDAAFPALSLAGMAFDAGPSHCLLFNSVNEVMVERFLADGCAYRDIVPAISRALDQHNGLALNSLDDVLAFDAEVRHEQTILAA